MSKPFVDCDNPNFNSWFEKRGKGGGGGGDENWAHSKPAPCQRMMKDG